MGMMEDKVVIVTGAGRGIGRGIAMLMAEQGAKVVVNDLGGGADGEGHDKGPGQEVVESIRGAGGEAVLNDESVADWDAANRMVEQAKDTFGRLDAVVNNAGILRDRIFHKMSEEEFDAVVAVHLKGCFNVSRAAAETFRNQSGGAFVHMTSTSGLVGNFGQVNYGAAKLGIAGLSKCIALDMSRYRVRSNCISPFAWSRLIGTIPITDEAQKARVEKLKEMTPDKIASVAVALASDLAAHVTGQIFAVRNNEIFLMGQSRPIRGMQRADGWTPHTVIEHAFPALENMFYPLHRSQDIFNWDPV